MSAMAGLTCRSALPAYLVHIRCVTAAVFGASAQMITVSLRRMRTEHE